MGQQLTGMVGVKKVMSCSHNYSVMTTCILFYTLKASESPSASFQSNNGLTGGSFHMKPMLLLKATFTVSEYEKFGR